MRREAALLTSRRRREDRWVSGTRGRGSGVDRAAGLSSPRDGARMTMLLTVMVLVVIRWRVPGAAAVAGVTGPPFACTLAPVLLLLLMGMVRSS